MYLSADTPTRSVRPARHGGETYLVLGGEGHKVGQEADTRARYAALEAWARDAFGVEQVDYRWSAQDYVPVDGVPYIGQLCQGSERLWVATGFKKWGMTSVTCTWARRRGSARSRAACAEAVRLSRTQHRPGCRSSSGPKRR